MLKRKEVATVKIDSKGRVVLPQKIRSELGINLGDTVHLRIEGRTILLSRVLDPIAVLGKAAEAEYRTGQTRSLRDYMKDRGIEE